MKRGTEILLLFMLNLLLADTLPGQETSPVSITKLQLNTQAFNELSPVLRTDGIMFCSDRRLSSLTDRTSFDNRRLYNLYFAARKDSDGFERPVNIKSERTSLFNTGPFAVSGDGSTIYFTSEIETGIPTKNKKFRNHSGIFSAPISGQELLSIVPFKHNNIAYNTGQPSISGDGKILCFASDMPGGYGKSDIYYCELINGEWSDPVNMGPKINSASTDNFPFIHPSGRLYFASNRAGGMGGLDVYSTDIRDGSWEEPVRLAEPINSAQDDFAFSPATDLRSGYFSSNRKKSDDIYEFKTTIIRKSSCNPLEINNYCYEFAEENAIKYDTIPFLFEWTFGDGAKDTGRMVDHCYEKPGKYLVQLNVTNMITNEIKLNEKSQLLIVEAVEQPYISCPDIIEPASMIKFSADSTNLPGWEISEHYWNFGDETIASGSNVNKSFRHPGTFNVQLIIYSLPGSDGIRKEACVSKDVTVLKK